ncbi:hypothetical protein MUP59_08240 [Candidatus Bathyarchaeota archaeon]|nr:hypothetical protein [Candidatus Bathyarchaeota archaeon]
MKCPHMNVEITERGTASTVHIRNIDSRGHTTWIHDSDFGLYTGSLEVWCPDCGLDRHYGKRQPRWLVEAFADAIKKKE